MLVVFVVGLVGSGFSRFFRRVSGRSIACSCVCVDRERCGGPCDRVACAARCTNTHAVASVGLLDITNT